MAVAWGVVLAILCYGGLLGAYVLDHTPHMGGRKWWWALAEWTPGGGS